MAAIRQLEMPDRFSSGEVGSSADYRQFVDAKVSAEIGESAVLFCLFSHFQCC